MKPKTMTPSVVFACLLALLGGGTALGQASADPLEQMKQSPEYKKAYKLGSDEADKEIKDGVATLYAFGLRSSFENFDRETGLPYESIAGCLVDDKILGRAAGHNDRIAESIKKNGRPANSFKAWEKELSDPKAYFEEKSRSEKPASLAAGAPAVKSPDGKATIRPTKVRQTGLDGNPAEFPVLAIQVDGVDRGQFPFFVDKGQSTLVWGPAGSNFAVIRSEQDGGKASYLAVDLKRASLLNLAP